MMKLFVDLLWGYVKGQFGRNDFESQSAVMVKFGLEYR